MPTAITLASPANFNANAIIKGLPVIAGMQAWSYFGVDLATSQNVGPGGAYTHFKASPVYSADYITCTNANNGIQTPLSIFAAETILIVARQVSIVGTTRASNPLVVHEAASQGNLTFQPLGAGNVGTGVTYGATIAGPTSASIALATPASTTWGFYACCTGGATIPVVYDLTRNTNAVGASAGTNVLHPGVRKVLGSTQQTAATPDVADDIAFFALYNAILTKPQIDAIYANVKQMLLTRPSHIVV